MEKFRLRKNWGLYFLILFLFLANSLFSQVSIQNTENNNITDDLLINGRMYIPDHYKALGNPFFEKDEWMKATIFTMGEVYHNQIVKLNIVSGKLILNTIVNDKYFNIELNTQNIDSFIISPISSLITFNKDNKNDFDYIRSIVRMNNNLSEQNRTFISFHNEFYERLYSGKYTFLKKYKKEFKNNYSQQNHFGLYTNQNYTNFILSNNELTEVTSKNQFLTFFDKYKSKIRKYLSINKINYRKALNPEIFNLMKYCDSLN